MNEISGIPTRLIDDQGGLPPAKNSLGKDDFMKLLLSQLKHQDPLRPMDHQEFASQLAQFGQLEQLTNIGAGISGLKAGMGEGAKVSAIGMIGKQIKATGAELELIEGEPVSLQASLPDNFKPVKASIIDGSGKTVRELNLDGKSKDILWDGKNQEGISLPSGRYLFRVHGVGPNGQAAEAGSELSGRVVGVEMDGAEPSLLVQTLSGQTKVALAKVQQVLVESESNQGKGVAPAPEANAKQAGTNAQRVGASTTETDDISEHRRDRSALFVPHSVEGRFR